MDSTIYLSNVAVSAAVPLRTKSRFFALLWSISQNDGILQLATPTFFDIAPLFSGQGWLIQFNPALFREFNEKFPEQAIVMGDKKQGALNIPISHVTLSSLDLSVKALNHALQNHGESVVARQYVFTLLSNVSYAISHAPVLLPTHEGDYLTDRLVKLIAQEISFKRKPAYFAKLLGVSERKLNHLCRQTMGKGINELIQGQKLSHAQKLLDSTALLVKEIAYELDFNSAAYFVRFFKKHTGMQPLAWRQKSATDYAR